MLAKQKQAFRITQGQNKRFVVCEQNKLFIDLLRSHVVSTFLWPCLFLVMSCPTLGGEGGEGAEGAEGAEG